MSMPIKMGANIFDFKGFIYWMGKFIKMKMKIKKVIEIPNIFKQGNAVKNMNKLIIFFIGCFSNLFLL